MQYLDDFLILGPPNTTACQANLSTLLTLFEELGLPVAPAKLEGPATCITFLGIEIDTMAMEIRLPADKVHKLKELLEAWLGRRGCTRGELESLIGHLSHASVVVRAGKTFLRRLLELLSVARRSHHFLRLNALHRSDLGWWAAYLRPLNHTSFFRGIPTKATQFSFYSDASGSIGCGAIWSPSWFQIKWQGPVAGRWPELGEDSIMLKELLPIVWAIATWGSLWRNASVIVYCDNQGTVAAVNSGHSKVQRIMHLLRCLFFIRARYDIDLIGLHVPGVANGLADAISRDQLHILFSQVPAAPRHQWTVPGLVLSLTLDQQQDWTCPSWRESFASCFPPV